MRRTAGVRFGAALLFAAPALWRHAILPAILQAIDQGKTFLHAQYDPGVRLLRESPIVAPERHWLATDNRLAVYALAAAGDGLAPSVAAVLAEYGAQFDAPQHGLIEALTGAPIPWPPRTHTHTELAAGVWNEERLGRRHG